jgi:hypothetical protein
VVRQVGDFPGTVFPGNLNRRMSLGIGFSVAAAVLAHGASVVISSSSSERVNAAVERLRQGIQDAPNVSVKGQAFDIKDFATLKTFLSHTVLPDHPEFPGIRCDSQEFRTSPPNAAAEHQLENPHPAEGAPP